MYFIKELCLMIVIIIFPFINNIKYRKIASTKTDSYNSTRDVTSGAGCNNLCSQNNRCVSDNFNKNTDACELNDDHRELKLPHQHQTHWVMYRETCDPADYRTGNKCIRLITTLQTWTAAKEQCESKGYQLVVIKSTKELQYISKIVYATWVGGICIGGVCRWVDEQQLVDYEVDNMFGYNEYKCYIIQHRLCLDGICSRYD